MDNKQACTVCGIETRNRWPIWIIQEGAYHSDAQAQNLRQRQQVCAKCLAVARKKGYTPIINKDEQRVLRPQFGVAKTA